MASLIYMNAVLFLLVEHAFTDNSTGVTNSGQAFGLPLQYSHSGYHTIATIGDPPQAINLLVDTGSSHIIVQCSISSKSLFVNTTHFDAIHSGTLVVKRKKSIVIETLYGLTLLGTFRYGNMVVGSHKTCHNCNLLCLQNIDSLSPHHGLMGLSYVPGGESNVVTFLSAFSAQQSPQLNRTFALQLCGNSSKQSSWLYLGGLPPEVQKEKLQYVPTFGRHIKEFIITSIAYGNQSMIVSDCWELNTGKISTGVTGLHFPRHVYYNIIQSINASLTGINITDIMAMKNCWNMTDEQLAFLRPIRISILQTRNTSLQYSIAPSIYMEKKTQNSSRHSCYSPTIKVSGKGTTIGSTALHGMLVHFDMINDRLGFKNVYCKHESHESDSENPKPFDIHRSLNLSSCEIPEIKMSFKTKSLLLITCVIAAMLFILLWFTNEKSKRLRQHTLLLKVLQASYVDDSDTDITEFEQEPISSVLNENKVLKKLWNEAVKNRLVEADLTDISLDILHSNRSESVPLLRGPQTFRAYSRDIAA